MIDGEKLRWLRVAKDLSQKELAYEVGLSASSIAMYELGKRSPTEDKMREIADYFGTTVFELSADSKGIIEMDELIRVSMQIVPKNAKIVYNGVPLEKPHLQRLHKEIDKICKALITIDPEKLKPKPPQIRYPEGRQQPKRRQNQKM
jgi:transcriptional regulator with XRE-family HTH domain